MPNTWGSAQRRAIVWIVGVVSVLLAALSVCVSLRSRYWYPRIYGFWVIAPSGGVSSSQRPAPIASNRMSRVAIIASACQLIWAYSDGDFTSEKIG